TRSSGPPPVKVAVALRTERYTLPNGLEVVLHEDHSHWSVAVSVRYHVGGKDDPPGRSGLAHLFEHLMFGGSKNVKENGHHELLQAEGAWDINAGTSLDATEYYESVSGRALPLALWLEADRMGSFLDRVDDKALARERDVV